MVVRTVRTCLRVSSITTPPFWFGLSLMGTIGPAATTTECFAEHSHAGGQADPREERGPADEEGSQDAGKRPETHVLIAKHFQVSASIITMIRVVHSSRPACRSARHRDYAGVAFRIEAVPVDVLVDFVDWLIRLGIEVHFQRISDAETAPANFTNVFTSRAGDGGIKFLLGHRILQ